MGCYVFSGELQKKGWAAARTLTNYRISLIPSGNKTFRPMRRLQFPLRLCFAMTIHKSPGQTLTAAGPPLEDASFSHGQLYIGCSKV